MINLDTMSAEELRAFVKSGGLIYAQQDEEPAIEQVQIPPKTGEPVTLSCGLTVTVDVTKLQTWRAAKLISRMSDERLSDAQKMPYVFEFYEYVMGDGFEQLIDYLGGEEVATYNDVQKLVAEAIEAAGAKN